MQLKSPPPVITHNQSIQRVTHDLTGSPGHRLVPHKFGKAILGNGGPYRTRVADVGNVMCNETEISKTENPN